MARVVAHRGQCSNYPENTLPALKRAIACGAQAVEFDLQMSANRVPVVCHDVTLARTGGVEIDITQTRYEELRRYSVSEPHRLGDRFAAVRLPSLHEVVALLRLSPQVTAFVELKEESLTAFGVETFVAQVCHELAPIARQCVVIADSLEALLVVRRHMTMALGWIVHRWDSGDRTLARHHRLDYLVINHRYCADEHYNFATDPWQWVLYETCEPQLARTLLQRGAAWVESNDPCNLLQALGVEG
ncbi:MAG: glycerophosphodiester phosphodiesterase family protein [Chromatiales bacterium]|nr:glycerophosphodiester phosphodiesterase family protein [Chromatiales bacterium]